MFAQHSHEYILAVKTPVRCQKHVEKAQRMIGYGGESLNRLSVEDIHNGFRELFLTIDWINRNHYFGDWKDIVLMPPLSGISMDRSVQSFLMERYPALNTDRSFELHIGENGCLPWLIFQSICI